MLPKWLFIFVMCAFPVLGRQDPRTQSLLDKLKERRNDFKLRLHKVIEEGEIRQGFLNGKKLVPAIYSQLLLNGSAEVTASCTAGVGDSQTVFVATSKNELFILQNVTLIRVRGFWSPFSLLNLQALQYGSTVLLIAQHGSEGRSFIDIHEIAVLISRPLQRIRISSDALVSATKFKEELLYIAIVKNELNVPELSLYQMTPVGTQEIDEIFRTRIETDCSGLTIWTEQRNIYIALSYAAKGKLEIKQLLESSRRMSHIQTLDVSAHIIKTYEDGGSSYLVCGTENSIIIYWWTGSTFSLSRLLQIQVTDIVIYKDSNRPLIAVVTEHEVEFVMQDSSAEFTVVGRQTFDISKSLRSVLLWKNGADLYMLPLFKEKSLLSVYGISLEFHLSDAVKEMSFDECVEALRNRINEREGLLKNLSSAVEHVWSSSTSYRLPSLKVKGTIKSRTNSVVQSLNPNTGVSPLAVLTQMNMDFLNVTLGWENEFSKVLLKSSSQTIKRNLQFTNLSVQHAEFDKLSKHLNINDVATDRLYHSTLKYQGDQVLTHKITVENAFCKTATTSLLNGNRLQDYVLLRPGYCIVTGDVTFKNISAQNVYEVERINNLAIKDMVLTTNPQVIWGQKTFESLTAKSIQTTSINGIQNLSEIQENVLRDKKVNFTSTLNIEGNLDISFLHGRDVSNTFRNMVKKNSREYIRGVKTFKSLEIRGNVKIDGDINGISLMNIMTIDTNQSLTGNIEFSAIDVAKDVLTDSLNGYNLSSEAVVKSSLDFEIKGVKTFENDLKVSNINMKNLTLIDFVDPSVEFSGIFDVRKDIAKAKSRPWIIDTSVTIGNIEANSVKVEQSLSYLEELINNVWLKSTEQNIPRLNAERITFKNLNASKLGGINVGDFVTVNGNDYIEANIAFTEDIFTGALELEEKADLNMPPEFWNPDVEVKIKGTVYMVNAKVEGNLNITGDRKNLDFMHADEHQVVKGPCNISRIFLKDLTLPAADFDVLNGIPIQDYFESSVLLFNDNRIYNKSFSTLKGRELNCSGTLNNVMIDKVVTTNTDQKLESSYRFLNTPSFNNGVEVKKFFGDIGLESVVYTDVKEKVSNKYFNGSVITSDVSVEGNVSGVNVTSLDLAAFNKRGINYVGKKITFRGNLSAREINIAANRSVDGLTLDNLIRIDESAELGDFYASSVTAKNVRVIGGKVVNGCDLEAVSLDALWLERGVQDIPNRLHVSNIKIHGNLEIEYVNAASTSDLIDYLQSTSAFVEGKNLIFGKVKTENVNIAGTINDIGVGFLLQDYVQKSKYQVIKGKKLFKRFEARTVMADTLQSNKTCGIDVSKMYRHSISKSTDMPVYLKYASLPDLNATRVTVRGKINGLTLPEDVVLTNSTEVIEDEVTLDLLNAPAGLKVLSKIDGIDLESFIDRRISLTGNEKISSEIIFKNDTVIKGDCSIQVINGITFGNIVSGLQKQVIKGRKIFTGDDLSVTSNVVVNGFINQIDIQHLLSSLVRKSANESIKGVVNFSEIGMPSLVCYTINGDIYNDTYLLYSYKSDKLDQFTSSFESHRKSMHKLDSTENSLLLYKWFELHKILNYGSIERFLPVYEYGTHGPKYELEAVQMVMWVKKGRRGMKSIIADIKKDGTIVKTNEINGKVFPFFCSIQEVGAVGLYVQVKRCARKECIVIMTLLDSGEWKNTKIPSTGNGTVLDVQLFEVEDMIFLILSFSNAGSSERITVYRYETDNSTWVHHQKFHLQDMTSFSILEEELDETTLLSHVPSLYLAVTGGEKCPDIIIYEWDSEEFIHVFSNISTSVSTYATWVYNDRTLYLLLAKEKDIVWKENNVSVNIFNEPLEVYTIHMEDENLLSMSHTVNVKGVSFLETFGFREETFVLATSKHFGTVYVLQFRGYNGLELIQEISSLGVTETRVFTVGNHLYLALNSVDSRGSSSSDRTAPARILKAAATGRIQEDLGQKNDTIKLFV